LRAAAALATTSASPDWSSSTACSELCKKHIHVTGHVLRTIPGTS
jgi:hypothetical protein